MGKLYAEGQRRFRVLHHPSQGSGLVDDRTAFEIPRIGLILGTGWSQPDVLKACGFVLQQKFKFTSLGLPGKSGAGHPNAFLFGAWHGKNVVISQGRYHLYQDTDRREVSIIRQWMSYMLYFMGGSKQLVITSAVGGIGSDIKEDMLIMPSGIVSAHLPMPYLNGSDGEFVLAERLLQCHGRKRLVFTEALKVADCKGTYRSNHYVVPGPGFGGATERIVWKMLTISTVGMSLDPELRLTELENLSNRPAGEFSKFHETDIRVFPVLFVSDAHDLPNNDEIQARAAAMAPKFGQFLSHVVQSEW